MTRQERRLLRETRRELCIQLIDQGCKTFGDAAKRDYVTFVHLVQVMERLGCRMSSQLLEMAAALCEGARATGEPL